MKRYLTIAGLTALGLVAILAAVAINANLSSADDDSDDSSVVNEKDTPPTLTVAATEQAPVPSNSIRPTPTIGAGSGTAGGRRVPKTENPQLPLIL